MDGVLLIDKPSSWTSFDVVNKIRRMIEQAGLNSTGKKRFPVGHTGTLDPLATGLLVLMLGSYTKEVSEYTKLDKTYEVTMRLGQTSTTGDEEGDKTNVSDRQPLAEEITAVLQKCTGEIMQTPPAFSAVKVNGQRAYKLARAGKIPELKPRPAKVYKLELKKYKHPFVELAVEVSSGTYIRSLVEDIGKELQTGAYMTALRRTKVGPFLVDDAMPMNGLTARKIAAQIESNLP